MDQRPPHLQAFLDGLYDAIRVRAPEQSSIGKAASRMFGALRRPGVCGRGTPASRPATAHLPDALARASCGPSPLPEIADAFAAISPLLAWRSRDGGDARFYDGHANASIVGPTGYEERQDVWVGVSLIAPGVRYPDHQHPPEEIYVVLSPGEWRQGDGDWFEPGPGGVFYNPPGIVHAMRSGPTPLFAAWCLWLGDE